MKSVFFIESLFLVCFVLLSQVTAKVRLMLARLASVSKKIMSFCNVNYQYHLSKSQLNSN